MRKAITALVLLSLTGCATEEARQKWFVAGAALVAGAAIYSVARNGGGGGMGSSPIPISDYQWHWDQFYNQGYQLVWACRGAQTGEFAEVWRCNGQSQVDWKWPQK